MSPTNYGKMSVELRRNMQAAGLFAQPGAAAHHIVACFDRRAAGSRRVLQRFGIEINAAANGVYLPHNQWSRAPGMYHPSLHTDDYHEEVASRLATATTRENVLEILDEIRGELLNSTFPH